EDPGGDDVLLDLRGASHDALGPAVEVDFERLVVGVERGARPGHAQGRPPNRLLDPRHQELVDRPTGAVLDTVQALGQPAAHVQPQHLRLHARPLHAFSLVRPERARILTYLALEIPCRLGVAGDVAELAGLPFVADDRHGDAPTIARLAAHVLGRDAGAVEQDLPEL